jgi:hypothetical protein
MSSTGSASTAGPRRSGYQAHDPAGQEHPALILGNLVNVVRATAHIGVVGPDVQDPAAATEEPKAGSVQLRASLRERLVHRIGTAPGQAVQPGIAGPDHPRPAPAVADHLPRVAPGHGSRGCTRNPATAKTAGPRSSCDQARPPDRHPAGRQAQSVGESRGFGRSLSSGQLRTRDGSRGSGLATMAP